MIWWKGAPRATKMELEYMDRVRSLPCLCCAMHGIIRRSTVHHIKCGNKRMGHRFVLALCKGHHKGEFEFGSPYGHHYYVHGSHRMFVATFGTERSLWEHQQILLGLPTTGWPESKILSRRVVC